MAHNPLKDGEVINDLLGYDGLKIIQKPGRFHFSLDSTVLAHFVTVRPKMQRFIDLCSGNAAVPLMLSLRTSAPIDAVELQTESADQGVRSILLNGLESQITMHAADLITIHAKLGKKRYDGLTCNPPYFKATANSNKNAHDALTMARHEVTVTLEDVVRSSQELLKVGGRLAMVHRSDRLDECLETFKKFGFEPKRLRFVHSRADEEGKTFLVEAVLGAASGGLRVEAPLVVYDRHSGNYTVEILQMFQLKKKFEER